MLLFISAGEAVFGVTLAANANATVFALKQAIAAKTHIPPYQQCLKHAGVELTLPNLPLRVYGVGRESTVRLLLPRRFLHKVYSKSRTGCGCTMWWDGRRRESCEKHQGCPVACERSAWVPDVAGHACGVCRRDFSWHSRRRHHCRTCGDLVCYACSSQRLTLLDGSSATVLRSQRVCDRCSATTTTTTMTSRAPTATATAATATTTTCSSSPRAGSSPVARITLGAPPHHKCGGRRSRKCVAAETVNNNISRNPALSEKLTSSIRLINALKDKLDAAAAASSAAPPLPPPPPPTPTPAAAAASLTETTTKTAMAHPVHSGSSAADAPEAESEEMLLAPAAAATARNTTTLLRGGCLLLKHDSTCPPPSSLHATTKLFVSGGGKSSSRRGGVVGVVGECCVPPLYEDYPIEEYPALATPVVVRHHVAPATWGFAA